MQFLTCYNGNSTNIFVFDLTNVSETTVYLVMIEKGLPDFIAYPYCFQLTSHISSKPKVRPQNTAVENATSILFSPNVVTKKFFFYSLTLKFMKL